MFDVLVVGGGAMGSSIAWHLAGDPNFTGSVVVIERDPTYARASSALSASSIRQQFSTPLNIHLSRYGIGFLRQAPELLGVDLGLKEPGYLFLASAAGEAVLRANHAVQKGEGCAVELLDPAALRRRFPWISSEGVPLASHGVANEGWFDGPALMQAFRRKARELGAQSTSPTRSSELERQRGDTALGRPARGPHHRAGRRPVVGRGRRDGRHRAAGRAAPPLGVRVRCRANRRGRRRSSSIPSGTWFRPEGRFYIGGTTPAAGNDPPGAPLEVQHQEWDDMVWPVLANARAGLRGGQGGE